MRAPEYRAVRAVKRDRSAVHDILARRGRRVPSYFGRLRTCDWFSLLCIVIASGPIDFAWSQKQNTSGSRRFFFIVFALIDVFLSNRND